METTFYFISFYSAAARELSLVETRKMVCYSDSDLLNLRAKCRKLCRDIFRRGLGRRPSDIVYFVSAVSEHQYNESTHSLL